MSAAPTYRLIHADAGRGIPLADGSVDACITSPPFYGLRSYSGVEPTDWPPIAYSPLPGSPSVEVPAMRCCLGLEPTIDAYAAHLVLIFRDVRRVLNNYSCAWINLGDSYCSTAPGTMGDPIHVRGIFSGVRGETAEARRKYRPETPDGLKPKDLLMIPSRVALALQADGWYLRSAIPWVKYGNAMPESVQSRPTTATEWLFMLAKNASYYFDMESVRREMAPASAGRYAYAFGGEKNEALVAADRDGMGVRTRVVGHREPTAGRSLRTSDFFLDSLDSAIAYHQARAAELGRLRRSGGAVGGEGDEAELAGLLANPESYRGSHYATWPRRLVETMVKCSTSEGGVCVCGRPWKRVVEVEADDRRPYATLGTGSKAFHVRQEGSTKRGVHKVLREDGRGGDLATNRRHTLGWRPTCPCPPGTPTRSPIVLDPFGGSGTTAVVALSLGRSAILIDASAEYLDQAARRLERPHAPVAAPARPDESRPLFAAFDEFDAPEGTLGPQDAIREATP